MLHTFQILQRGIMYKHSWGVCARSGVKELIHGRYPIDMSHYGITGRLLQVTPADFSMVQVKSALGMYFSVLYAALSTSVGGGEGLVHISVSIPKLDLCAWLLGSGSFSTLNHLARRRNSRACWVSGDQGGSQENLGLLGERKLVLFWSCNVRRKPNLTCSEKPAWIRI